jgi:hypothetical protein
MEHISVESTNKSIKKVPIWRLCFAVSQGRKKHLGKFKKRWFGPFRVQYYLPNNIIILVFVINFEPNPILVNINKLKPNMWIRH